MPSASKSKSRDLLELAIAYGLILAALWTSDPAQTILFWIAWVWVIVATLLSRPSAANLGLRPANAARSALVPLVALLISALAVWIASALHTLHAFSFRMALSWPFWAYILWTFLQQFALQDYFLLRVMRLVSNRPVAVLFAGILFAGAHLPNPLLTAATLIWGIVSCMLFLRDRDLYSLGIAQGILGLCMAVTIPGAIHHEMRVGLGYLHWSPPTQQPIAAPSSRVPPPMPH